MLKSFAKWLENPDKESFFESCFAQREVKASPYFRKAYDALDRAKELKELENLEQERG